MHQELTFGVPFTGARQPAFFAANNAWEGELHDGRTLGGVCDNTQRLHEPMSSAGHGDVALETTASSSV